MSQVRLADLIGVTFQQVQKYEKGVNRVSVSTLVAIADALETRFAAFLPNVSVGSSNVSPLDEPGLDDIAVVHHKLNSDGKALLLKQARALLEQKSLRKR